MYVVWRGSVLPIPFELPNDLGTREALPEHAVLPQLSFSQRSSS